MRRSLLPSLLIAVLASAAVLQAQSKDEQAIRALLDLDFKAGNTLDEKILKQHLANNFSRTAGPFYPPSGEPWGSVSEMEKLPSAFLGQITARSYVAISPIFVRVDKNIAWAAFTWHAEATFKDGTRHAGDGRTTATFVREGKNWKFAHLHVSVPAAVPPTATALNAEAQTILQVERSAWEALKNKQPAAWADYFAEDASIFVEDQAYRVRGKAEILRSIEAWLRQATLRSYQILDPQVQVVGDTALLTYYFTESGVAAGKEFTTAGKLSVVFVKQEGAWRALHEHRSVNR